MAALRRENLPMTEQRRDRPEPPPLMVLKGLQHLLAGVHHEWPGHATG